MENQTASQACLWLICNRVVVFIGRAPVMCYFKLSVFVRAMSFFFVFTTSLQRQAR